MALHINPKAAERHPMDVTASPAPARSVASSGAISARDVLIERMMDRLVRLTRRMLRAYPHLRRWEETDDVFQEAALRLYRALREVEPRSTREFFGLAALQIRRTLIDLARHHFGPLGGAANYRSDPLLADGVRSTNAWGTTDCGDEPQSLADWTAFHAFVDELPAEERDVFHFVWYGAATYAEAAELLGVTRRTAIRRMNRARRLLAPAVAGLAIGEISSDGQFH